MLGMRALLAQLKLPASRSCRLALLLRSEGAEHGCSSGGIGPPGLVIAVLRMAPGILGSHKHCVPFPLLLIQGAPPACASHGATVQQGLQHPQPAGAAPLRARLGRTRNHRRQPCSNRGAAAHLELHRCVVASFLTSRVLLCTIVFAVLLHCTSPPQMAPMCCCDRHSPSLPPASCARLNHVPPASCARLLLQAS